MSNKSLLKDVFTKKYSADKNYQKIIKSINNKKTKKNDFLIWFLVPGLSLIFVVINIVFMAYNGESIYVNNLADALVSNGNTYGMQLFKVYDIKKDYKFVSKIKIPDDLNEKEEEVIYLNADDEMEIHDYVIMYYNIQNKRSVNISFSKKEVDSLLDNPLEDAELKTSKINGSKVLIASFDDRYYAKFEYQNLNMNIETNNMTLKELVKIIKSIIK